MVDELALYLGRKNGKEKKLIISLMNEYRDNGFWMEEEQRKCRICRIKRDNEALVATRYEDQEVLRKER